MFKVAGFPRRIQSLDIQAIFSLVRQFERNPERTLLVDGDRTPPGHAAISGDQSFQRDSIHRVAGIALHLAFHHESGIRQVGVLLRVEGHLEGRKDKVIDP